LPKGSELPVTVRSSLVVGAMLLEASCMETRRSPGDDCLKDDDCLSGVCSQLHCTTRPPTIDVQVFADGATADAPSDAAPPPTDAMGGDLEADAAADEPDGSAADVSMDDGRSGD
jgi:hypothetical protein